MIGANHRHNWEIKETIREPLAIDYIEIEVCCKCNAKRSMLYPHGIILHSEPKPVPKFCPVILDKLNECW